VGLAFHYVVAKTFFGRGSGVGLYHCAMFHGSACRVGAQYPLLHYALGDELRFPLHITHNAVDVPAAFMPYPNMVVAAEVKARLEHLPNVRFLPVTFGKLFSVPWRGRTQGFPLIKDTDVFLERQRHDPSLEGTVPPCFEVTLATLDAVARDMEVPTVRFTPPWGRPIEAKVSADLLARYPLVWHGGLVLSPVAMGILRPYLDLDFFRVLDVDAALAGWRSSPQTAESSPGSGGADLRIRAAACGEAALQAFPAWPRACLNGAGAASPSGARGRGPHSESAIRQAESRRRKRARPARHGARCRGAWRA